MIVLGILGSFAVIGLLCWLLFTLAVFALPFFVGVTVGFWSHETGAGIFPAFLIGAFSAGVTFGVGQYLLAILRSPLLRLLVALAFVAPAALAGFYATYGIVKHTMPSETWQFVFGVIGAVVVGITAFVRVTAMAAPESSGQGIAAA
ncbi:hypothetical protein [Nitratireductor soli]|uniref:hypothetical protein n=1 Tax=Nitratireductor soli TaxID=1670619 RepID=UPI00065DBDC6|nr:hypothetical protein [Nitratireductor soli]